MSAFLTYRLLRGRKFDFFKRKNGCRREIHLSLQLCSDSHLKKAIKTCVNFSNGSHLFLTSGQYARIADGSAVATIGDTSVMVTAVSKTTTSSTSMLPLVVDYRQKAAAVGRIPTNFLRRELAPTEHEILTSRLIDRSLRPLFPDKYSYDTQIMCNILALDGVNDPDVLAINAASLALSLSDIPWNGPVGAVRIGQIDDELLINPTKREMQQSILNLVVTATSNNLVVMAEASSNGISNKSLYKAIEAGVKECQSIVSSIKYLQQNHGKTKRSLPAISDMYFEIYEIVEALSQMKLRDIFMDYSHDKLSRDLAVNNLRTSVLESMKKSYATVDLTLVVEVFGEITKKIFRKLIFETEKRCDGRTMDELRNIQCQIDLFKPLQGSAVFQRGQTQVLCTVTLDSPESALKMDTMSMITSGIKEKNFFLHYEFPPFATNETGRIGPAGRRELGHGALAEKGLRPVIPKDYPFTIRLTSEVLESNGSSSMASVCGGSLALMDAGVPIRTAAAGVAIGLVTKYGTSDSENKNSIEDYRVLTDILGIEDYAGDLDLKIAGTETEVTALQADIKIPGLPLKIVSESLQKAQTARGKILKLMNAVIPSARQVKKDNMPVTENIEIPPNLRGKFLGVGGFNIKKILIETGVQIHPQDENTYTIFAPNQTAMDEAREIIKQILEKEREPELEFGGIYPAKIIELRDSGVLVTLFPGMTPTLLHNSQLDTRKVGHPSALGLEVGQEIHVKYFGRDPVSGFMRLSRKVLQNLSGASGKDT